MKKFSNISRFTTFALAATLCMPAHAMWLRQAGQKVAALATAAAHQARSGATTLAQTSKNLQRALTVGRGAAQTTARAETATPAVRPAMTRVYTDTYAQRVAAAQPMKIKILNASKKIIGATTALAAGYHAAAYVTEKMYEERILQLKRELSRLKFDILIADDLIRKWHNDPCALGIIIEYYIAPNIKNARPYLIEGIIKLHPSAAQRFAEHAVQNFTEIDPKVLLAIMKHYPAAAQRFTDAAVQKISASNTNILRVCMKEDPTAAQKFTDAVIKNYEATSLNTIKCIIKNYPAAHQIFQQHAKKTITSLLQRQEIFESIHELTKYNEIWGNDNTLNLEFNNTLKTAIESKSLTVTEQHLFITADNSGDLVQTYCDAPNMALLIKKIVKEERIHQKDYYTFVHGQKWQYLLPEKAFTDLWAAHRGKTTTDFLFAHARHKNISLVDTMTHKDLLKNGRTDEESRQKLLFLNAPFFGNETNLGSATAHYFISNTNCGEINKTIKDVFAMHGDTDIYERYKQEFEALQNDYDSLSTDHGNILFFAIPKKLAKDYVFLAVPGGYKKTICVNGQETDDISVIMNAYQNQPESMSEIDRNEFCLIMCGEAMNPESGIKVKVFNDVDPEKMAAFWKKYEALMAKVKAEIETQANTPTVALTSGEVYLPLNNFHRLATNT